MKKFFIIFAFVGVALIVPTQADAQTKAFKEKYKAIAHNVETQINPLFKEIEVTLFSGDVLRSLTPKDKHSDNNNLVKRIDCIYQLKMPISRSANWVAYNDYMSIRNIVNSNKYTMVSRITIDNETYEIFRSSQSKPQEFMVIISNKEKAVICDIVGYISLQDVLNLIDPKVKAKINEDVIDSLDLKN